ncbi:nucleolar complex protein 4 homolog [Mobula hypostoma]|uniref:nucleolar complex protein 4 homolog n=1 Tax=Mobula hypostoma TaxID=723540 RepID=UPI002FC2A1DC
MAAAMREAGPPSGSRAGTGSAAGMSLSERLRMVLGDRRKANGVIDILEALQAHPEANVLEAIRTCSTLFCTLLQRGDMFVGQLPGEDKAMSADFDAETKYKIWMRHRYRACVQQLFHLMDHGSVGMQELALRTLMKFVQTEGMKPLVQREDEDSCIFPVELLTSLVKHLLSVERDASSLISCYQTYLKHADVRYYTLATTADNIPKVIRKAKWAVLPVYQQNVFSLLSSIYMPTEEKELTSFLVKQKGQHERYKAAKLEEHKKKFEQVWLVFLKYKLPAALYKKVLVILHEDVLPHMSDPTLMIDFLTAAYDMGGAISLLALNGLFYLIHQHNLEYPDFYKKLYSLLDPSVLHVKYRARFFHLLDLFLSSSHLPAYLIAAFSKRLSRLALTAPPEALLMAIPLICNLIRRHPSCKVLLHRPAEDQGLSADPYVMDEEEPSQCRALESSLWELQTLQQHYHPDVANAAAVISKALSDQEADLSMLFDLSVSELFEKEPKKRARSGPLEFEPAEGLLNRPSKLVCQHWALA